LQHHSTPPGAGAPADASTRAGLAIPYLGQDPPPSRPVGTALKYVGVAGAVLRAALALNHFHRAVIAREVLDHGGSAELQRKWSANSDLIHALDQLALLSLVVVVILEIVWRERRRPASVRRSMGEAYVESPLRWVVPGGVRVLLCLPALPAILLRSGGVIDDTTTPFAELPHRLTLLGAASACWALLWLAQTAWVFLSDRALDRRIVATGGTRVVPTGVPSFPPVPERDGPIVTSDGIGWVFRTAGLVVGGTVALVVTLGGVGELLHGSPMAVVWLALGLVGDVLVVRTFARRVRSRGPARDGRFS
jgi:hypothetical protein